jgi:hypothetical protein
MNNEISKFLIYQTSNQEIRVDVFIEDETIWMTQKSMGELFSTTPQNITLHLKNIYEASELIEMSTCKEFLQVRKEGKRMIERKQKFYNLDAIISVGYRVNSSKATQFRIWATQTLKEYIIKGFVMDDVRLKEGQQVFGKDYFKELLQRIRSIRASERRIYQQITDIFAECSIDYDKNSEITKNFFAFVQNKFHFAITGKTAAEIIYKSVDKTKENLGLTTWKNSPEGRILKSDVLVAKNYLEEKEINQLERTVSSYFDYIEGLIERQNTFTMEQLSESVNKFLTFNEYRVLDGKGSISKIQADKKASLEYDEFNKTQKILSDFDKHLQQMNSK